MYVSIIIKSEHVATMRYIASNTLISITPLSRVCTLSFEG